MCVEVGAVGAEEQEVCGLDGAEGDGKGRRAAFGVGSRPCSMASTAT